MTSVVCAFSDGSICNLYARPRLQVKRDSAGAPSTSIRRLEISVACYCEASAFVLVGLACLLHPFELTVPSLQLSIRRFLIEQVPFGKPVHAIRTMLWCESSPSYTPEQSQAAALIFCYHRLTQPQSFNVYPSKASRRPISTQSSRLDAKCVFSASE
jgi:hypothetical protein